LQARLYRSLEDMMTTTGDCPVTEEVVRSHLPLDPALYSIWMPGDITTVSIQSTWLDPVETLCELIGNAALHRACAGYLIRMGAPVFKDAKKHDAYVDALESRLREGISPAAARDAALLAVGSANV
jgi:hypothetical protein